MRIEMKTLFLVALQLGLLSAVFYIPIGSHHVIQSCCSIPFEKRIIITSAAGEPIMRALFFSLFSHKKKLMQFDVKKKELII